MLDVSKSGLQGFFLIDSLIILYQSGQGIYATGRFLGFD